MTKQHETRGEPGSLSPLAKWLDEVGAKTLSHVDITDSASVTCYSVNGHIFLILRFHDDGGWEGFVPLKSPMVDESIAELAAACGVSEGG